jgi:hypothetical protein
MKHSATKNASGVAPGNHADRACVDLLEATVDLVSPGFLGVAILHNPIGVRIKALEQRIDERGADFGRKRQGIFEQRGGSILIGLS